MSGAELGLCGKCLCISWEPAQPAMIPCLPAPLSQRSDSSIHPPAAWWAALAMISTLGETQEREAAETVWSGSPKVCLVGDGGSRLITLSFTNPGLLPRSHCHCSSWPTINCGQLSQNDLMDSIGCFCYPDLKLLHQPLIVRISWCLKQNSIHCVSFLFNTVVKKQFLFI